MAAQQAADGQVKPLERPVFADGLDGILRAGGREAARGGRQRGNAVAVEIDGQQEHFGQQMVQAVQYVVQVHRRPEWGLQTFGQSLEEVDKAFFHFGGG